MFSVIFSNLSALDLDIDLRACPVIVDEVTAILQTVRACCYKRAIKESQCCRHNQVIVARR